MRYTNSSDKITDNSDFHRKQFQLKQTVFKNTKTFYVNLFPTATLGSKPWVTQCMIMFSVPTVVWRKFHSETKRMKLIAILVLYVML